jgi:energy-coupling factor transport system permease protein
MVKDGVLKKSDPRPKLLMMAVVSTICFLSASPSLLLILVGIIIATLLIGGAKPIQLWRRTKPLLILILSLFLIQSIFFARGDETAHALLTLTGVTLFYQEGVLLAAVLSLRLLIIVLSAQILLEGEIRDYMLALVQMHVPYEIAFMVTTAFHFLPILREEALNIYACVQLRGARFKGINLAKKLKAYTSICLPILVCTLRRAEEMSIAMETRGLRSHPKRTAMRHLTLRPADVLLMILWPAAILALYFGWNFYGICI